MSQTNKNLSIDKCIFALASGDNEALDILYELIKDDIYAFALSKVKSKMDAEDIMQDTFLRIYENSKLYQSSGKPMSWIFTIEINIINRFYQIKSRSELIDEEVSLDNISSNTNESELMIKNDYLNRLLNKLDIEEREIISLHIVSDLRFREISKILNKPLSTVLNKYNRAIKKIKKIAKEEK